MSAPVFFVHDAKRIVEMTLALVGKAQALAMLPDPETYSFDEIEIPTLPDETGRLLRAGRCPAPEQMTVTFRRFQRSAIIVYGRTFRVWRETKSKK